DGRSIPYAPPPDAPERACGTAGNPACPGGVSLRTLRRGNSGTCPGSIPLTPPLPAPDADHDSSCTTSCRPTSACTRSVIAPPPGSVPARFRLADFLSAGNSAYSRPTGRPAETHTDVSPAVRSPPYLRSGIPCRWHRADPPAASPDSPSKDELPPNRLRAPYHPARRPAR